MAQLTQMLKVWLATVDSLRSADLFGRNAEHLGPGSWGKSRVGNAQLAGDM